MASSSSETRLFQALRAAVYARTPEERRDSYLSPAEIGVLFDVSSKTVERARLDQAKALSAMPQQRIDELALESLIFIPAPTGSGRFVCRQDSVFDLFRRRDAAAQAQAERIAASMGLNAVLAFHAWACDATPIDTWPFSIQSDGRPLDFCAAILSDRLTGEVEWLTLREFSDQLADVAAKTFHTNQADALDEVTLPGRTALKKRIGL